MSANKEKKQGAGAPGESGLSSQSLSLDKQTSDKEIANSVDPVKDLDPAKETILVLEDSKPNRNILSAILAKLGYQVLVAENGSVGRTYLEQCVEMKVNLTVVITDIMMPEVDGFQFIAILRACETYAQVPALFITALADKSNVVEAARVRASGYLLKPVSLEQIKDKLKSLFPERDFSVVRRNRSAS